MSIQPAISYSYYRFEPRSQKIYCTEIRVKYNDSRAGERIRISLRRGEEF